MDRPIQDSVIRDLISAWRDYRAEFKRSVIVFLVIGIPVSGYFIYHQLTTPPKFVARASFMLNENGAESSGLATILGQFGFSSPGQQMSLQKIVEIARTRILAEKVFMTQATVNEKKDLLANHLISQLKASGDWTVQRPWLQKDLLQDFRFDSLKEGQEILWQSAVKKLHQQLLKMLETYYNEKTGIMELSVGTESQDLSYALCHQLYAQLSSFYVDKAVQKQKETYEKIKFKVDSLRALIQSRDYALAGFRDSYRNTWTSTDAVPQTQIDRDVRMLNVIYAEALKNQEIASFTLQNQTPFIQSLDLPLKPLEQKKEKLFVNLAKIIFLTLLLGSVFIIFRKIIRDNS